MEKPVSANLSPSQLREQAEALKEVHQKAAMGEVSLSRGSQDCYLSHLRQNAWYHLAVLSENDLEKAFYLRELANTALPTIAGYQQLLQQIVEAGDKLAQLKRRDVLYGDPEDATARLLRANAWADFHKALADARAALPEEN